MGVQSVRSVSAKKHSLTASTPFHPEGALRPSRAKQKGGVNALRLKRWKALDSLRRLGELMKMLCKAQGKGILNQGENLRLGGLVQKRLELLTSTRCTEVNPLLVWSKAACARQ